MNFQRYGTALKFASRSDLVGLMKSLRENPHQDNSIHAAVADALEELHPDNPITKLIHRQFGLNGKEPQNNEWYDPIENSWDGTFPYTADLGTHAGFRIKLAHESVAERNPEPNSMRYTVNNPRWVIHAVSTLPDSKDTGYSFEFPHEEAHQIPNLFPKAEKYIDNQPHILSQYGSIHASPAFNRPAYLHSRNREANQFDDAMDEQERNRN